MPEKDFKIRMPHENTHTSFESVILSSILIVTNNPERWHKLVASPSIYSEPDSKYELHLSWRFVSPQAIFHHTHESTPALLLLDTEKLWVSLSEWIRMLRAENYTKEAKLVVLSDAIENEQQDFVGADLFLPTAIHPTALYRIVCSLLEPQIRSRILESSEESVDKWRRSALHLREKYIRFASRLSHEIRTPLGIMEGFVINLMDGLHGPLHAEQQDSLSVIHSNMSRLKSYLGEVLNYSPVELNEEAGVEVAKSTKSLSSQHFKRRYLSIYDVVRDVLKLFDPVFVKKQIVVRTLFEENLPRIWMDGSKIRQVLINLLSNAHKYTKEKGTVEVRVTLERTSMHTYAADVEASLFLKIEVEDTGQGIPSTVLPQLFGDFVRGQSESLTIEGSGIGLAVCKQIMETHQGQISIDSVVGQGTCVRLFLPIDLRHENPEVLYCIQTGALIEKLFELHPITQDQHIEWIQTEEQLTKMLESGPPRLVVLKNSSPKVLDTLCVEKEKTQ